jgi:periplasmic divalent cation tolerance protein
MIKTRRELFDKLRAELERTHTYEVPEVVALPIVAGSERYLNWLDEELNESSDEHAL